MPKIEEKQGKTIAIARFWMRYKIYLASLGPYYNWSNIVMHEPSNKTLIPNIQMIESAYS